VVDSFGNGLPGIFVNAIAGFTVAETDETGEYSIPMPELRLFLVRTFATVPTNLGTAEGENPFLVFQSDLTELSPSGVTTLPDIVVDIGKTIEKKIDALDAHESQMYEWGPWTEGRSQDKVPKDGKERRKWLADQIKSRSSKKSDLRKKSMKILELYKASFPHRLFPTAKPQ